MLVTRFRAVACFAALQLVITAPDSSWGQTQQPQQTQQAQPPQQPQQTQPSQSQPQPPPAGPRYEGSLPAQDTTVYGGGWGGGYRSSTAAGDALQGMSSAISAQGQKNLNDSLAALNLTAASSASIDNHVKYSQAEMWYSDTIKQRREQEFAESLAKHKAWHEKIAPRDLTPEQFDQTTGTVRWPMLCADPAYSEYRRPIDESLAKRARYGAISMQEFTTMEQSISDWRAAIRADKDKYPMPAVKQALRFLNSLSNSLNEQFG